MNDINQTCQSGRLVKDAENKVVGQTSVTTFTIATNFSVKNKETNAWDERAYFFNVNVWGKYGEHVVKFLKKGKKCTVAGRLQQRTWNDKITNEKKYAVDIIADSIQFEYPPKDPASSGSNMPPPDDIPPPDDRDYFPPDQTGHGLD